MGTMKFLITTYLSASPGTQGNREEKREIIHKVVKFHIAFI